HARQPRERPPADPSQLRLAVAGRGGERPEPDLSRHPLALRQEGGDRAGPARRRLGLRSRLRATRPVVARRALIAIRSRSPTGRDWRQTWRSSSRWYVLCTYLPRVGARSATPRAMEDTPSCRPGGA